jgi:phosphonate transport system substrate-binding protein
LVRFVSLMSQNALPFCRALASYLAQCVGTSVDLVDDEPWQLAERQLYAGEADLGVVCGLQYVRSFDRGDVPGVELLAAPVMAGARYEARPIYFSDVIVRADSTARSFEDLRGCAWGYNEPTSHSGYALTRYWLATRWPMEAPFFGSVVASGAHVRSLEMLLEGEIDATAIDSTVLETELRARPRLHKAVRIVHTLGPSPIPPLVISRTMPAPHRAALRTSILEMHLDPEGAQLLANAAVSHFAPVSDADYDPIRAMSRLADQLPAWPSPEVERNPLRI